MVVGCQPEAAKATSYLTEIFKIKTMFYQDFTTYHKELDLLVKLNNVSKNASRTMHAAFEAAFPSQPTRPNRHYYWFEICLKFKFETSIKKQVNSENGNIDTGMKYHSCFDMISPGAVRSLPKLTMQFTPSLLNFTTKAFCAVKITSFYHRYPRYHLVRN